MLVESLFDSLFDSLVESLFESLVIDLWLVYCDGSNFCLEVSFRVVPVTNHSSPALAVHTGFVVLNLGGDFALNGIL